MWSRDEPLASERRRPQRHRAVLAGAIAIAVSLATPVFASPLDVAQLTNHVLQSLFALGAVAIVMLVVLLVAVARSESKQPREMDLGLPQPTSSEVIR